MRIFRLLFAMRTDFPRVLPLMRNPGVPLAAKLLVVALSLFILSPLNVLGDIPFLGFLDDAALLAFVLHRFVRYAEPRAVRVTP